MALSGVRASSSCGLFLSSFINKTCKRNYVKGNIKDKNKVFKLQWNKENLTLFGPLMKNGKIQQPIARKNRNANKISPDESMAFLSSELLTDLDESITLPCDAEFNSSPTGQNIRQGSGVSVQSEEVASRLQGILRFPLQTEYGNTNPIAATATRELAGLPEFSQHGEYRNAFPSVSKILEKSRPPESDFFLKRWMKMMIAELGEEGFKQHQKETRERGSAFHNCVMQALQGVPVNDVKVPVTVEPMWASLGTTLEDFELAHHVEAPVRHPLLHYCGVFDCLAPYKDTLCLIDWKVSKKPKPYLSNTYDNPLQLAAYLGALHCDPRYKTQVNQALLVIAYDDGQPAHVHSLNPQQCVYYWGQWLRRLHSFWSGVLQGTISL